MPTAVAKKKPTAKCPQPSEDSRRILALMRREEPLRGELRPYLGKTNTVFGTILKPPFYVGGVNHCFHSLTNMKHIGGDSYSKAGLG